MQATVSIPILKSALAAVRPATRPRDEVLTAAHLHAIGSRLAVTATDSEFTIRTTIPAQVAQAGTAAVDHRTLAKLLHGAGTIELTADGVSLQAVNGATTTVESLPDGRYPTIPDDSRFAHAYKVDVAALRQVVVSAAVEATRPFLLGVLFDGPTMLATDTYRLHTATTAGHTPRLVVPAKGIATMLRKVPEGAATVTMLASVDGRHVQFRVAGSATSWTLRVIDEPYPPVDHLFPGATPNRLEVDRELLIAALDRAVEQMTNEYSPVQISSGADSVELTLERFGEEPHRETLPALHVGEPVDELYNPKLLRDAAIAVNGRSVVIDFPGRLKPVVIHDGDGSTFRALLMPVAR